MRRELLVLGGVLVPFALLVALAWVLTTPRAPGATGSPAQSPPGQRPPTPVNPGAALPGRSAPGLDAGAVPVVTAPPVEADAGAGEDDPALAAPLRALAPEVRLCFEDRVAHVRGPVKVQVAFRPTPDGGFDGVRVETTGVPDPTFGPCIEDAFEEVRYAPTGRETFRPATHTFIFDPPRR